MAKRAEFDRAARRSQILAAAIQVYADRGYHRTRVEDIADAAGVSKGTLYLYFESREHLFSAAFEDFMTRLSEGLAEITASDAPPLERLAQVVTASLDAVRRHETLSRVMVDFWSATLHNPDVPHIDASRQYREIRQMIAALLDEAAKRGEIRPDRPALTESVLMAAMDGIILHWLMSPDLVDIDTATEQLLDLIVSAIRQ